ncbi:glycoside-pentoside-hexuronide (GPH):cation symporter [Rothia uropygialis]|uniref:glycoside-pentoside-hexuronide (GPH):cation symporter n=1 Tax=Kocuria sp. 36 TaxID=1415402 RepID=UPI00101D60EC|nr:glycoside-pentoside-hexuronide (GPH):cation symporter [Kocuria sp. 36]
MSEIATSSIPHVAHEHLPKRRIAGYGLGDAGCNVAFQMTGVFLLLFYTDVAGIQPAHASAIFLFVKFWDAFADLFAGRMVDRTMTRWGKFRPFLLWYSVPLLLSNVLCFWIPVDSYATKIVWATVSYALLGLLYSMVNIPFGSLAGAMSQNPVDRSRLASARMVGSGATILLLSVFLAPRLKQAEDLATTFLVTSLVFLVIGAIFFYTTFLTSKEVVFREVEKVSFKETLTTIRQNGPLLRLCASSLFYLTAQSMIGALTIYLSNVVLSRYTSGGWVASVSIIITTGAVLYVGPFGPLVTRAMGKKRGFVYNCMVAAAGGVLFALSNSVWHSLALSLIGLFLMGVGMGLLNTMTWALEADTVEYGEYRTGVRTEGATYAAFSFTRKVGQALGQSLGGIALTWAGYTAGKGSQGDGVVSGLAIYGGLIPAAIFILAMLIMTGYPLTEAKFTSVMKSIEANRRQRHEGLETGAIPTSVETSSELNGPTARASHPATSSQATVPGNDQAQIHIVEDQPGDDSRDDDSHHDD